MEFANRIAGASSQHHGNSCPYLAQAQHRPMPQSESFHSHAFGWGLPGQHPAAPYPQWPAPPPPATLEMPPTSQGIPPLRAPPPTSGLDPYQFLPGTLPPPQQHQHQPANFRPGVSADNTYGGRGDMSSGGPTPAAPGGDRSFHHAQNSRLPGQGPPPPSLLSQPHAPPSLQSQEQTRQPAAAPSHPPPPHSNEAPQHPPPLNPSTFTHNQHTQGASHPPPSGSFPASSPADTPSLLSQQHQQLQQQHQQYQSSMSGSSPPGTGGAPPPHGRPAQVDAPGQYQHPPGQTSQDQRQRQQQQTQPQDSQSYRHPRPPTSSGAHQYPGAQPVNIPPHLPSLLNPNHLQHHYGHDYHGAYSENMSHVPANQRDLPRLAPPNLPLTSSDNRRRTPSSRPTRRSVTHAVPLSSERDQDVDNESSPASSPGSSIDHAVSGGVTRHGPNDRQLRAAQVFRGSVSSKKVASSTAISSLQSVDVESLSAAERSCVICYNDFGTETPEGVREAPLRLPKCKHVFGDHCIKKWFEESDSCPYCRTKVPSELRFVADARALMDLMRARGGTLPTDLNGTISQEAILRLVSSPGAAGYEMPGGTRRSPPSEGSENRRRIRPRHSGTMSSPRGEGHGGGNVRPLSFSAHPSSSNHSPPSRDRHPLADYHPLRGQDREREWVAMHMPHSSARHSQPRAPHGFYNPYSWEESPLVDPSGRLPMPAAGGLPPMHAFPAPHSEQQNSPLRGPPGTQPLPPGQAAPFSYMQSLGLRSQRDAGAPVLSNFNTPANTLSSAEAHAPAAGDTDIPMPDRDTAP